MKCGEGFPGLGIRDRHADRPGLLGDVDAEYPDQFRRPVAAETADWPLRPGDIRRFYWTDAFYRSDLAEMGDLVPNPLACLKFVEGGSRRASLIEVMNLDPVQVRLQRD